MLFKQGLRRALCSQHLSKEKNESLSQEQVHHTRDWIETQLNEWISTGDIPVPLFKKIIEASNNKGKSKEEKEAQAEKSKELKWFPAGLEALMKVDEDDKPILDDEGELILGYKFKRDPNTGKFDDSQLAAEMARVMEDSICQFGAQNVPKVFKGIEILGILQARKWEVATLNEFRELFGLERHKHFEDINEDKGITNALRDLYEDPDMVELRSLRTARYLALFLMHHYIHLLTYTPRTGMLALLPHGVCARSRPTQTSTRTLFSTASSSAPFQATSNTTSFIFGSHFTLLQ